MNRPSSVTPEVEPSQPSAPGWNSARQRSSSAWMPSGLVARPCNFANRTPGVAHAMVVSADGLPVAVSERLDRPRADQLAAIASGLASLTQGGARCIDGGLVKQTVVEMDRGLLVVMAISDGSCLAVLAASSCDVAMVAYEMTVLVTRTGEVLTPSLRAELQAALPP
jgi:predicted regulator of Ras-like GTPase activity (Roadblock/LC7/MglB family)